VAVIKSFQSVRHLLGYCVNRGRWRSSRGSSSRVVPGPAPQPAFGILQHQKYRRYFRLRWALHIKTHLYRHNSISSFLIPQPFQSDSPNPSINNPFPLPILPTILTLLVSQSSELTSACLSSLLGWWLKSVAANLLLSVRYERYKMADIISSIHLNSY
jgi:hypothetical protein